MTWLALWPVERMSSWSSELELESGIDSFFIKSFQRRGAEYAEIFMQASRPHSSIISVVQPPVAISL